MEKKNRALSALLYFCVVIGVFSMVLFSAQEKIVNIEELSDLSRVDFSVSIARIDPVCFEWYPEQLLAPDDFALGGAKPADTANDGSLQLGTYRLVLQLMPGRAYGLAGISNTYAQALWVDGELLSRIGKPGESAKTTVPGTNHYAVYFTAKEKTEVVIQWSNFVHYESGLPRDIYVGEQGRIATMSAHITLRASFLSGCTLMACLFLLGIFLFFRGKPHFLWFALACLMITLRTLLTDHYTIMLLIPNLSWALSSRLEYISTMALFVFTFAYINHAFNWRVPRAVNTYGACLAIVYISMVIVTPPIVYTRYVLQMEIAATVYMLVAIALLARSAIKHSENRHAEHFLITFGTAAYFLLMLSDVIRYRISKLPFINLTQIGMMVFVLAGTLALSISFTRTETALMEAKSKEREMEETNRMLERLNHVKSDFLGAISHEMRTSLTIMGGYAGLTLMQIQKDAVTEHTVRNLDVIQREAVRLGNLVEQVKEVALEKERRLTLTDEDAKALLKRAANFCGPICQKNGNRITLRTDPEAFSLRVNADAIFQMLFNLISNANRHVRDGVISLTAALDGETARLEVRDSGKGIDPALLPHIFERGVSCDGSTGLGLAICKEIAEEHGGAIHAESEPGKGTLIRLLLPARKELSK